MPPEPKGYYEKTLKPFLMSRIFSDMHFHLPDYHKLFWASLDARLYVVCQAVLDRISFDISVFDYIWVISVVLIFFLGCL